MTDFTDVTSVLFAQAHGELLHITEQSERALVTQALCQLLDGLGFESKSADGLLTLGDLEDARVLVLGAPTMELDPEELQVIQSFLEAGGGVLLVSDAGTMASPIDSVNVLAQMAGLEFQEYLNYQPSILRGFFPHYVTANVGEVEVRDIAGISLSNGADSLAVVEDTFTSVVACSTVGQGRVVAVGDVELFTDLLAHNGNRTLVANAFRWLAFENTVDVQDYAVPHTVKWGQSETVVLRLRNESSVARPQVECVLESDVDALISEPTRKVRSIPPGRTTQMQWMVTPQVLGDQKIRLTIHVDGQSSYYDQLLPRMNCEAPGYLTLQTRRKEAGEPETEFRTGDRFVVEGAVHWSAGSELPPYHLDLECPEGVVERSYQPGEGLSRWYLLATVPGEHKLILRIRETGQSLPALVTVRLSLRDQLDELRTAYVYPLDVEIAERLQLVDRRFGHEAIRGSSFEILVPERYITEVYDAKSAVWLKQLLAAARREQWYNLDLLNLVLTHFAPAHLPGGGSFVPYDPDLVDDLARLHPPAKWRLESNFVRSTGSESTDIRQNIAAYLLHEKYGHGFFYAHTRLGQQLAVLQRHGFLTTSDRMQQSNYEHIETARVIKDSAVIVDEGFAAWLELTFLSKLDHEVRQAVFRRRVLLLQKAKGLREREKDSLFFQMFPSRFDSPYREGFEYLDFISQNFGVHCAIRAFCIATNTELGISEDADGLMRFDQPADIRWRLLEADENDARSHIRLHRISELLYDKRMEMQNLIRKCHCPEDREKYCPIATTIEEELGWR